jgi:hypothetical protein
MDGDLAGLTVTVSYWRSRMPSAWAQHCYVVDNVVRRTAGARKARWGSTLTICPVIPVPHMERYHRS